MNTKQTHRDEISGTDLRKRHRKLDRHYSASVWRSAELTAVFKQDQNLQQYLKYLLDELVPPEWIPASNRRVRHLIRTQFADAMVRKFTDDIKPKGQRLYHATLAFEEFVTGDRCTVIDWPVIKRKVGKIMRRLSRNFIGVGEIDVILNKKVQSDGKLGGRLLGPHFHVLFWTDAQIQTVKLSNALSEPFEQSPHGMKVVKITECKCDNLNVKRVASYLFKSPKGGKKLWMKKRFDVEGALKSAQLSLRSSGVNDHRKIVFSRLSEILSHSDIRSLMISGGDGLILKGQLLRVVTETLKLQAAPPPQGFGYEKTLLFWKIMRLQGVGARYSAPLIT